MPDAGEFYESMSIGKRLSGGRRSARRMYSGKKKKNDWPLSRFDVPAKLMRRAFDRLGEMSGYIERGASSALRLGGGPEHNIHFQMFQPMNRMRGKMKWSVSLMARNECLIMT
jgi:hypothetical protein